MNSYAQFCIVIHTYHYIFALLKANCTLKVGWWPPRPVLQQPAFIPQHPALRVNIINNNGGLLEDGARRPRPT